MTERLTFNWTPAAYLSEWLGNVDRNPFKRWQALDAAMIRAGLTVSQTLGVEPVGACPKCKAETSHVDRETGRPVSALSVETDGDSSTVRLHCVKCGGRWSPADLLRMNPEGLADFLAAKSFGPKPANVPLVAVRFGNKLAFATNIEKCFRYLGIARGDAAEAQCVEAPDEPRAKTLLGNRGADSWVAIVADDDSHPVDLHWHGLPLSTREIGAETRRESHANRRRAEDCNAIAATVQRCAVAISGGRSPDPALLDTVRAWVDSFDS